MEESRSTSSIRDREQKLIIHPDGSTEIEWVSLPFSRFIIDHVYNREDREIAKKLNTDKIYCG